MREHFARYGDSYKTAGVFVLLVALLALGVFYITDRVTARHASAPGQVTSHTYHAPWNETIVHPESCHTVNKQEECTPGWTQTINHPAAWNVCVSFSGHGACENVNETTFDALPVGQHVTVYYDIGGFTGIYTLTAIHPVY